MKTSLRRRVEADSEDTTLAAYAGPTVADLDEEDGEPVGFVGATDKIDLNEDPDEQAKPAPEEARPDPEQSQYWKNVQTPPVNDVAPRPEKRPGKPEDRFKVLSWPKFQTMPLAAYYARLQEKGMPIPETLSRSELVGLDVNISDMVRARYLEPLSEDNPEQPWLAPEDFSAAFLDKYTNDAPGRFTAVFEFLRNPQRHELYWQIPQPVQAQYVNALTDTLKPSPAVLKTLLLELDRSDQATQALAFTMLKRSALVASGKPAQPAIPVLQRMLTDFAQWDGETIKLLLTLLTAVQPKPAKLEFMLLRRLQMHESDSVRTSAIAAEFTLFVEPRL